MNQIYGTGTTLYGVSKQDSEGHSIATKWITLFFFPIIPLSRYKVKFKPTDFGLGFSFSIISKEKIDFIEVAGVYVKGFIIIPSLYFVSIAAMFYFDSIGLFKGPHVLLVLLYWAVLTAFLMKLRRSRVKPNNDGKRKESPTLKMMSLDVNKYQKKYKLPPIETCPYCNKPQKSVQGEIRCSNCSTLYNIDEHNNITFIKYPRVDIIRKILFVLSAIGAIAFYTLVWTIDISIGVEHSYVFLLLSPWLVHFLLVILIAVRYGFVNAISIRSLRNWDFEVVKVCYESGKKHFIVHFILMGILSVFFLAVFGLVLFS